MSERTRDLIAEHGWTVIIVPSDEHGPGFAYSIGLFERFAHPEVAISGLPNELIHRLVNDAAALIAGGTKLADGEQTEALIEDLPCSVQAAHPSNFGYYFGEAQRYYGDQVFGVIQVFWPDQSGRFPWDPGYASAAQARIDRRA
jgi:hypothetical protein